MVSVKDLFNEINYLVWETTRVKITQECHLSATFFRPYSTTKSRVVLYIENRMMFYRVTAKGILIGIS